MYLVNTKLHLMKLKALIYIFPFILMLVGACSSTKSLVEKTESEVSSFATEHPKTALSISVIKDGVLVYSEGKGLLRMNDTISVSPSESLFRIASISKSMTSALFMRLQEEGKLHIDSSVYKYLPNYPKKKHDFTLRQVGSHTAGIRTYLNDEFLSNQYYESVEEGIAIFKDDSLLFAPGAGYTYSTYGWNLMSYVAEKVCNKDFNSLMQSYIFKPFGLEHTYFNDSKAIKRAKYRTDYLTYQKDALQFAPEVDLSNKWAGGGFESTSDDVAHFIYKCFNSDLINADIRTDFTQKTTLSHGKIIDYGVGWSVKEDKDGDTYIGHAGSGVGGKAMMLYYPEHKLSIVVLSNVSNINLEPIYSELAKIWKN